MKMGAIAVIKGWSANCMLCSMFILYTPVLLCSFHVYCANHRVSLRYGECIKDHEETLVSPGRKFELGFFSPAGSSGDKRYVGIWYMWDKRTVVWVANRDNPLINTTTGAFRFAKDGTLQVMDRSTEKAHWNSECYNWRESCNTTDTIVNLTDSGNLVLYGSLYGKVTSLWQSFENPTDTFLPGMTLSLDGHINLTSWRGRDDPGSGNFTFMLDAAENRNAIVFNKEGTTIYWKSSVSLYTFLTTTEYQNDADFENARLVMNFSGKIEYWAQSTNGTWYLADAEPGNNCSVYNVCGNFGSCNLNNKLKCKCLPGFKPYVAQKWHSGDFSDGCTKNSVSCGNTFLSLKMMKIGKNLEQRSWVENETECKELCLKHCDCKSYSYNQDDPRMPCWIWKQELVDVQEEYEDGYNISIRVAKSDIGTVLIGRFYIKLLEFTNVVLYLRKFRKQLEYEVERLGNLPAVYSPSPSLYKMLKEAQ